MRPYLEYIDIVLLLQHLEDVKELCQNALLDIDSIQKRGHLWIEEKETSTYTDLKQYIKDKSSEMLHNCISILHSKFDQLAEINPLVQEVGHESASTINDSQNDSLKLQMNDRLRTTQLEKIYQKLKGQEKMKDKIDVRSEISLDDFQHVESKYIDFYEELMAELDSNRSFMSQLNTQCHTLSSELEYTTEHKSLQQRKMGSINSLAELLFQRQYRFGKKCQVVLHNQDDFSHSIQDFLSQKDSFETSDEEYTRIKLQLVRKGIKTKQSARNLKDIKRIEQVNLDSIPELFFCVLTGQSNVKCNEDCPHVIGHHEQQISEGGEDDLYKHLEKCIKNPGHTQFIPVDTFSLEHLPEIHRDNELYTFVKAVADLTVKVSVTLVSPQRPEFWPETGIPYFLYNMKGSKSLRTGSGIVKAVIKWKKGKCPIDKYQHSFKPEKQWWTLRVLTAANVIFDDSEANHTTLRLFYDKEDSPEVVVNVMISKVSKDINNDISLLDCVTCELNLNVVNRLRKMVKHYDDLYEKVAQKYEQSRDVDKLMFIVSHPHGCRKQMRPYQEVSDTVEQLKRLDDINEFLHNVFDEISLIKKKGELWIEGNETLTFTEMKEFITEKTSEILQHTISVASTFIESFVHTASVSKQVDKDDGVGKSVVCQFSKSIPEENQTLSENVNKINYTFTLQSTTLNKLHQKVNEQQAINEALGKKLDTLSHKCEQETPLKLKDLQGNLNEQLDRFKENVMSELHSASIFITHLQTQCETLLKEQKNNKEINMLQGLKVNTIDMIVIQGQENLSTTQEDILKTPDHLAKAVTHIDLEKELSEIKDNQSQVLHNAKNVERELMRLSERPELLCQMVSDSDVRCFIGCPHIVGHHEQLISEGEEVDLHDYVKDCKNKAAHTQYIPVKSLRLKHLLKGNHDRDVYNLIKAAASLTVRISVPMISPHRPDVWPSTKVPYFLFNMIGSQHLRMASGIVTDITLYDDQSCPCDKCRHSGRPSRKWWRIEVRTAANVLFDDIEAGHSVIRLFYDTEDSPEFLVRSSVEEALSEKNINEDWCSLNYITCDAKLAKRLDRMVDRYNELSEKVTVKYKDCQNKKLMFLVSHPHGLCKQISIGQWETNSSVIHFKFIYSTSTCPGSAGAIAYFVGRGLRTHSGKMKSGLGYCTGFSNSSGYFC